MRGGGQWARVVGQQWTRVVGHRLARVQGRERIGLHGELREHTGKGKGNRHVAAPARPPGALRLPCGYRGAVIVNLHRRESGTGLPLVLLHAFPLSSAMWLGQREGLAADCRVITPDLRGFGGSQRGDDEPSVEAMADDVAGLLDTLGLDRVVLGGVSMGGYVAMAVHRRHPDRLRGLVLADTKAGADPPEAVRRRLAMAETVETDPDSRIVLEQVVPSLVGDTTRARRPLVLGRVTALAQAAPAYAVAWAQRAMAARPDSTAGLGGVAVPTLVVVGEEDTLSPVAEAEALAAAVPGAELVRIPAAGHLSPVEEPDAFNAAVRDFLRRIA